MNEEIENRILDFIYSNDLLVGRDRVLLGLSGGPDSVFAFHFFLKFAEKLNVEFAALHLNHHLRGTESDADEEFCRELCGRFNIRFFKYDSDILSLAKSSDKSVEEVARGERYKYFSECASEFGFSKIVTAHNMDDNTETVFLNLIKGGGISATAGIPVKRDTIIRPFLCISRQEIMDYLQSHRIDYRVDSSNFDSTYERNFLRNEILPKLRDALNPRLNEAVFNSSQISNSLYSLVSANIDSAFKEFVEVEKGIIKIDQGLFEANRFIIGEILKKVFIGYLKIEFNTAMFNMIIELGKNQVGRKNPLKGNWVAVRERESVDFFIADNSKTEEILIRPGEITDLEGKTLTIEEVSKDDFKAGSERDSEYISADNLDDIFILRKWKSGDVFSPLGMSGQKKVSDFLTDIKISNKMRKDVYVLLNRNKIVWLVGLRISEKFKIIKSTKRIIKLCLK